MVASNALARLEEHAGGVFPRGALVNAGGFVNLAATLQLSNCMLLAAVHVQPFITVPIALLMAGWIVWYWIRLGRPQVPASRRKIRRISLAVMAASLPMFVRALSFLDPTVQQRDYLVTWSVAIIMVLLVIVVAGVDAINSVRLIGRQTQDEIRHAADELSEAIKRRQDQERGSTRHAPTHNGKAKH